ncbi:BTAD domain-containing putative transcriptional regulator [Actinokineospora guangxiensis]|uniref:BTAD domain-containing putative transcriptional regulator n=1 Tax=Actinokineospora guangxiensis TaxID=1490288 RepID=A0ABW0EQQ8_9PSEU
MTRRGRAPTAIHRRTLITTLDAEAGSRLRLLVGPAGAGKSVLLRQMAAAGDDRPEQFPVVCPAGTGDFDTALTAAFAEHLGFRPTGVDALLCALNGDSRPFTVFIDDAHRLRGDGATTLARMLHEAPAATRFVVATRDERVPGAAGLGGEVSRFGYPDLRLRSWEVEEVFAEVYRSPLAPEAAATLCARVEGLAAALRLLHLETVVLNPAERAEVLAAPPARSQRIADFLDREVLGPLPVSTVDFMVEASPLAVLDSAVCDALLGRRDSADVLAELVTSQAMTCRAGGRFRFHVLLQQHLERRGAELRGAALTRQKYRAAAAHLTSGGHWPEGYRAHARAGDWATAAAVLHRCGTDRDGLRASASVPQALFDDDPWIAIAEARRLRGAGVLADAYDEYLRAEGMVGEPGLRWQCTAERSAIASWIVDDHLREEDPLVSDVSALVAMAVRERPARMLAQAAPAANPAWALGRALGAFLDARPDQAVALARPLVTGPPSFVSLTARLLVSVLIAFDNRTCDPGVFARLAADAEEAGWLSLARIARAATALVTPGSCDDAVAIAEECARVGDHWGELMTLVVASIGLRRASRCPEAITRRGIDLAQRLGAHVPEAWLRLTLLHELRRTGDPELAARTADVERVADALLPRSVAEVGALVAEVGKPVPAPHPRLALAEPAPAAPVSVRCLGRYELAVAGEPVDLDQLRAQARRVLRVLSMHYGHPLHEEHLLAALWPDAPLAPAKHRLQVAISSLRALIRGFGVDGFGIDRIGSAYLLRLPPGSTVDLVELADAVRRWRQARHTLDAEQVRALGHRTLDLYRGDLLDEEGPAEWVLARRETTRGEAAAVAAGLARFEMVRNNPAAAIEICERALRIDELDARLWDTLAEARHRTGNTATALRARNAYRDLVAGT